MEKQKFRLEFAMRSVPVSLLWSYISSATGLKEWFADAVSVAGKKYVFEWNGQEQCATVIGNPKPNGHAILLFSLHSYHN